MEHALLLALLAIGPQTPRPFDAKALLEMERLSDPALSPDGTLVLYTVSRLDLDANRRRTDLWLARTDGSGARQLTTHPANDGSGRWAPGGDAVYFLSARSGSSQVWRMGISGGEPVQVTDLPLPVEHMAVFPDGERLLLAVEVFPEQPELGASAARVAQEAASPVQARAYEELLFRHWDSYEDGRRSHLYVWSPGARLTPLTPGWDADVPPKPFGGFGEVAISPDGKGVVFAARAPARDRAWSTNLDLFHVPADGSRPPANWTSGRPGAESGPVFSPDGRFLAYLSMPRAGYEADRRQVVLRDVETGTETLIAPDWDRSPTGLQWSADQTALFATADHLGNHALFAIAVDTHEVRAIVERGASASPRALPNHLVYLHDNLKAPAELYRSDFDGSNRIALTAHNRERLAGLAMGDYEQFHVDVEGVRVYGYLVRPVDFDPAKSYPFAFLIHGGPQGSFSDRFHYRWNPQVYAGAGYATVMLDFRGSTGYGQAFTDAIRGDWGGAPYRDLMAGLDAALLKYPFLDSDRGAALGASYGGYMIFWIAGQAPDRFRCLVSHAGLFDTRMFGADTEELWFAEWEFGGSVFQNAAGYERHNPALHAKAWKTPMLVIHGAKDFRVVETQGFAAFTALQRQNVPSRLLYFPDENHWILKPHNSLRWHGEVLAWLDQHTASRMHQVPGPGSR